MKNITNILEKPAGWMYFILVVALLIIISSNSDKAADVQADLDNAIDEISTLETSLEASANELAVRDDAIAGLNNAIAGLESDSVTAMLELNDSDTRRAELEGTVVDLQTQLSASASALEDAIANPNCPATQ